MVLRGSEKPAIQQSETSMKTRYTTPRCEAITRGGYQCTNHSSYKIDALYTCRLHERLYIELCHDMGPTAAWDRITKGPTACGVEN